MPHRTLNRNDRTKKQSMIFAVAITLALLAIFPGMPLLRAAFSGPQPGLFRPGAESSGPQAAFLPLRVPVALPPPSHFRSEVEVAKGRFLVASRQLRDPNFLETVLFLIDYDQNRAMGLVINRATKVKLATLLPEIKGLEERTDTVYIGGPVARNQMRLLIRSGSQPDESHRVFEDIYVSTSRTLLEWMIDHGNQGERFRAYAGYAGWSPGQLDREVSRGDWHVFRADADTVFSKEPSEIWPEFIRRMSLRWVKVD